MRDIIVKQVTDKFKLRSSVGIEKYDTTLKENNADNFLVHLQEELMDATLYIEKLIDMKEDIQHIIKSIPNDDDLGYVIRKLYRCNQSGNT